MRLGLPEVVWFVEGHDCSRDCGATVALQPYATLRIRDRWAYRGRYQNRKALYNHDLRAITIVTIGTADWYGTVIANTKSRVGR